MKLTLDNALQQFSIFKDANALLEMYNINNNIADEGVDKIYANNLFNVFLELADVLGVNDQSDEFYNNFVTCMSMAFHLKGRVTSLEWLLAAVKCQSKISIVDELGGKTLLILIEEVDTPFFTKLNEAFNKCIPYLIWDIYGHRITVKRLKLKVELDIVSQNITYNNVREVFFCTQCVAGG